MHRRTLMKTASAAALAGLMKGARDARADGHGSGGSRPSYTAAVARLPALVPPSADALEDIRRRNTEAFVDAIETIMKSTPKPRVVSFPVLMYTSSRRAVSGVPMEMVAQDLVSKPLDQTIWKPVIEACRRHDCYVATSTQEKVPQLPGTYFHTGFIMGPEGLVLRSPKVQAPSAPRVSFIRDILDDYKAAFGPDSILPVAKTPIGTLACYVEGEAQVLEASRLLASKGAEVILHTGQEADDVPWVSLKRAIAYQNHVYLLTGTTSRNIYTEPDGSLRDDWAGGSSTICGPAGELLAEMGGRDEGYVTAEVDLAHLDEARAEFQRDTVPAWALYEDLYKPR
jgi:predicted amidohydrolase